MDIVVNKTVKRIAVIAGSLLILLIAWGCRSGEASSKKKSDESAAAGSLIVYYINDKWTDLSGKKIDVDQLASSENMVDLAMKTLLEGGESADMSTPVPDGMVYQRYIYDGYGTVNLIFNVDFDSVDAYSVVLSKMAFVKTLSQIEPINTVIYEMVDVVNESNVVKEELHSDSFADMDNIMDSEKEIRIYMPDSSGQSLVERSLTLDLSAENSLPEQVLQGLKNNYDGTVTPFSDKVVVKNVDIDEGLCTVTFNDVFVKGKDGVDDNVLVYSIVDSLLELDNIRRVQLKADNTGNRLNGIDLERKFTGDYSYVTR